MDRDKVMKGLQTCSNPNAPCDGCPYFAELNCTEILCRDALALLKEQEEPLVLCQETLSEDAIALLKEQEDNDIESVKQLAYEEGFHDGYGQAMSEMHPCWECQEWSCDSCRHKPKQREATPWQGS